MRNLKRALSLTLASVMLLGMMVVGSSAAGFPDVDDESNVEAIEVLNAVDVIRGYDNGDFGPDDLVTRAQMAVIMANLLNLDYQYYEASCPFTDVPAWARGYVGACYAKGIVFGYSASTYGANDGVTAVQAASMMMRALGYFQYAEDYKIGFELATVSQGSEIGIFDGVGSNATAAMTRNQVAQMALNALESDMVTFKGDIGWEVTSSDGTTIRTGYRADYQPRTGTASKYNALKNNLDRTDINEQGQYYIQLGEELYDGKLTKKGDTDAFNRPATTWRYDGKDIGTYKDDADVSYTVKVESGDIYKDLGLGSTIPASKVEIYVNGDDRYEGNDVEPVAIKRNDGTKIGQSGKGVLTEVYYDKDDNSVVITQVMTYIGEINRVVAATGSKDAYVEVNTTIDAGGKSADGAGSVEKFETNVSFADEDKVLYTFSEIDDEIKSVQLAETVNGNVTQVVNKKQTDDENRNLTMDGTKYDAAFTMAENLLGSVSVDQDYTIYLDSYGYVISVSEEDYTDYALVLAVNGASGSKDDVIHDNQAKLVFTDGTVRVVNTDKNYESGSNQITSGTIVTFKEKDNGTYSMRAVDTKREVAHKANGNLIDTWNTGKTGHEFDMKSERASIQINSTTNVYGSSKSMFVVYNNDGDDWDGYVGIKEAPTVKSQALDGKGSTGIDNKEEVVSVWYYCKSGSIVTAMFIQPGSDALVENENNDLLFLAGESVSDLYHDSTYGDYYTYNAVVNGSIETVMVDAGVANAWKLNGLYSRYTTDSDGVITKVTPYTTDTATTSNKTSGRTVGSDRNTADYTVLAGVDNKGNYLGRGTDLVITSADNRGIWTVGDDCKFYAINTSGDISEGRYSSVTRDSNDRLYYIVDGGALTYVFVETVDEKDSAVAAEVAISADVENPAVGDKVTLTADVELNDPRNDYVYRYEWYKGNSTRLTTIADVEALNRVSFSSTDNTFDKVDTKTEGDTWYYCVVTVRNDEVEGTNTAKTFKAYKVTVADTSTMTVTVNVVLIDTENGTSTVPGFATYEYTKANVVDGRVTVVAPEVPEFTATEKSAALTWKAGETNYSFTYTKKEAGDQTAPPTTTPGYGDGDDENKFDEAFKSAEITISPVQKVNGVDTITISGTADKIAEFMQENTDDSMTQTNPANNQKYFFACVRITAPKNSSGTAATSATKIMSNGRQINNGPTAPGADGYIRVWVSVSREDPDLGWTSDGLNRTANYEVTWAWSGSEATETTYMNVVVDIKPAPEGN